MSFHRITAEFQEQIDEFNDVPMSKDMFDDIHDILEEYCSEIEARYGVNMSFTLIPNPNDGKVKYEVIPASDLDSILLKHVVENEAHVGQVSFAIN